MLLRILILLLLGIILSFCNHQSGKREQLPLTIKHVFVSGVPDKYGSRADIRSEYYYIYNYSDAHFPILRNMLDTLFIDTTFQYHWYRFLMYNNELPDTLSLRKEMEDPYRYELEKDPGSAKYKDYLIFDFFYSKSFTTLGDELNDKKRFPDSYGIITNNENKRKLSYYLKDSVSGKLVEVDRSVVLP